MPNPPPTPMASKGTTNLPVSQTYFNPSNPYYANGNINSLVYLDENADLNIRSPNEIIIKTDNSVEATGFLQVESNNRTYNQLTLTQYSITPSNNTTITAPIVPLMRTITFSSSGSGVGIEDDYVGSNILVNITATGSGTTNNTIQLNSQFPTASPYVAGATYKFIFTSTNANATCSISNGSTQILINNKSVYSADLTTLKYASVFTPDGMNWTLLETNIS